LVLPQKKLSLCEFVRVEIYLKLIFGALAREVDIFIEDVGHIVFLFVFLGGELLD